MPKQLKKKVCAPLMQMDFNLRWIWICWSLISQSSERVYKGSDAFLLPHVHLFWCLSIFPILWITPGVYSRLCVMGTVCRVSTAGRGSSWGDATHSYQLQFMFGAAACLRFGTIFDTKGRCVPSLTAQTIFSVKPYHRKCIRRFKTTDFIVIFHFY